MIYGGMAVNLSLITDLYTFDESEVDAVHVYELVCDSYEKILKELNLPAIKG